MATAGILTIRAANTPEQHVQAVYKAEQDINSTKNENSKANKTKRRERICYCYQWTGIFW